MFNFKLNFTDPIISHSKFILYTIFHMNHTRNIHGVFMICSCSAYNADALCTALCIIFQFHERLIIQILKIYSIPRIVVSLMNRQKLTNARCVIISGFCFCVFLFQIRCLHFWRYQIMIRTFLVCVFFSSIILISI